MSASPPDRCAPETIGAVLDVSGAVQALRSALGRLLPKGQFARSVAVMGGGTAVSYGLIVAAQPIITRLFTPADYGVQGVYASIVTIALVMITWRYELAIPLPEDDRSAADVLVFTIALVVCTSAAAAVVVWLAGDLIVRLLDAPGLRPYLWLIPINLVAGGVYATFQIWAVRKKAFGVIAQTKLSQAVGMIVTQVGLGLCNIRPLGLLLGQVVRWSAGTITLGRIIWRQRADTIYQTSPRKMLAAASRYRRFPLLSLWSALVNNLSVQVPTLFLSVFFGPLTVGLYALTAQAVWMPMNFIRDSISQVFYSNASDASRKGTLAGLTLRVYARLVEVGMPYAILLAIAAPELFQIAFGRSWREAGVFAQWLCPWFLFVFVSAPVSSLALVLKRQHVDLFFQVCLLVGRLTALLIGGLLGNVTLAIALYGGVSAAMWTVYMLWLLKISGNRPRDGLQCLLRNLLWAAPAGLPAIIAKVGLGTPWPVAAGVVLGAGWVSYRLLRRRRSEG